MLDVVDEYNRCGTYIEIDDNNDAVAGEENIRLHKKSGLFKIHTLISVIFLVFHI